MESAEEAEAAVTALNGTDLLGRTLNVEKVSCEFLFANFPKLLLGAPRPRAYPNSREVLWSPEAQ